MELTYLQYFLRVAELGSINRAALDLNLSQPALSRNIAALEHEVGTALFLRRRDGVKLTEAGRLFADRARPLLGQFALIKEEVGQTAAGQVTLGLPQAWQNVFTIAFLAQFVQRHPAVARLSGTGSIFAFEPWIGGPTDLSRAAAADTRRYADIVKRSGISVD